MLQLLESYRSLTLGYMADAFGVTEDYMDSELCRYLILTRSRVSQLCNLHIPNVSRHLVIFVKPANQGLRFCEFMTKVHILPIPAFSSLVLLCLLWLFCNIVRELFSPENTIPQYSLRMYIKIK